jgi:hypothetical protein
MIQPARLYVRLYKQSAGCNIPSTAAVMTRGYIIMQQINGPMSCYYAIKRSQVCVTYRKNRQVKEYCIGHIHASLFGNMFHYS